MYRTVRGLTLGLVMLLGALTLTGLLAAGLQHRADDRRSESGTYSPADGATVDTSGWPIEERRDAPEIDVGTERSRSRLRPTSVGSGA